MRPSKHDISRRAQTRRAFAAILSGFAFFALIQLSLAIGVENGLQKVRDPRYAYRLELIRRRFHLDPVKPWTVLMLGSSRTQYGFRIDKRQEKAWTDGLGHPVAAFNLGVAGAGPLTQLLTWNRLRRDGVRPNLLLVEVTPPLLGAQIPPPDYGEVFLPTDRLSWQDLPLIKRYEGNARLGLRSEWLEAWPWPWYFHRLSLVSLIRSDLLPPEHRLAGADFFDPSGTPRFENAPVAPEQRARATQQAYEEYHPRLSGFRLGGKQCEALCELLASCRREGVSVALVLTPEGPTFRSWYPPATWQAVKEWLTQLSREYDAPLVNAREWIDDEECFGDSHHLSARGADKFVDRLGRETILPMLRHSSLSSP